MKIDLDRYCSKESSSNLSRPFSHGEFTYASNGAIAVRVPRHAAPLAAEGQLEAALHLERLFGGTEDAELKPFKITLPAPKAPGECDSCDGTGHAHPDCPDCECACNDCDGNGFFEESRRIRINRSIDLDEKLLRLMLELGQVAIACTDLAVHHGLCPIRFRFEGGDGLIMPKFANSVLGEDVIEVEWDHNPCPVSSD